MKTLKMVLAACTVCAMAACADNTPKSLNGKVVDATMNTVVVADATTGATYSFGTTDADKSEANGLLIGSPISVEYKGKLDKEEMTPALKIATDATYNNAVGEWTMPDPIDSTKVMGINIEIEGAAKSINMATLVYSGWELQEGADKILLKGQSLGNGQTIDFTETGVIAPNEAGVLTLAIEGTDVVYTKVN